MPQKTTNQSINQSTNQHSIGLSRMILKSYDFKIATMSVPQAMNRLEVCSSHSISVLIRAWKF